MKYFLLALSAVSLILLSGCSCKYKEQLEYYQSTIGNQCFYYVDQDPFIKTEVKEKLTKIQMETTKLLGN